MPSGVVKPNRRGIDGPVMSASRMPTLLPARRSPTASSAGDQRFADAALARHDRDDVLEARLPRELAGRAALRNAVFVVDRGHATREAGLRERRDDRFGPQAVRGGALRDRLVLVHPATGAVEPEPVEDVLRDGQGLDEFADVRLGTDGNGCRH